MVETKGLPPASGIARINQIFRTHFNAGQPTACENCGNRPCLCKPKLVKLAQMDGSAHDYPELEPAEVAR